MHERAFRRALALAVGAMLLATTAALADTVRPAGDGVTLESNGNVDLGTVGPGQTVAVDLTFKVVCAGWVHVDPGSTVALTPESLQVPSGGAFVSVSGATVGPAPSDWPSGGSCSYPAQSFSGGTASHVVIMAPMTPGIASYLLTYSLAGSPSGSFGSLSEAFATLDLTVSGDRPPELQLPDPMTVEGNATGGAIVTYTATATDAEDGSLPATCLPASGSLFPLGTTTVSCSATDSAALTTTRSFGVTVVDTTPPTLARPTDVTLATYDPNGALVAYPLPTATDIVDPTPIVACEPAAGTVFPVGTSTVTCTATDHSGNQSAAAFSVTVTQVHLGGSFEAPVGPTDALAINPGRTLPVKATVTADGVPVAAGSVTLSLSACGGGTLRPPAPLAFVDGRWFLGLDTSGLTGCTTATLLLDGHAAGSFQMIAASAGASARPGHRH